MAAFGADLHYMVKAMGKAGVTFPASKSEIVSKLNGFTVKIDYEKEVSAASLVEPMVPDEYPNADAFYNAYIAASLQTAKKNLKPLAF